MYFPVLGAQIAKQEALLKAKYGRIPAKKGPLGALRPGGGGVCIASILERCVGRCVDE